MTLLSSLNSAVPVDLQANRKYTARPQDCKSSSLLYPKFPVLTGTLFALGLDVTAGFSNGELAMPNLYILLFIWNNQKFIYIEITGSFSVQEKLFMNLTDI